MDELLQKHSELIELKQNLKNSDYKTLKYIEGKLTEEEFAEIKSQRQAWRDRINALKRELNIVDEEIL